MYTRVIVNRGPVKRKFRGRGRRGGAVDPMMVAQIAQQAFEIAKQIKPVTRIHDALVNSGIASRVDRKCKQGKKFYCGLQKVGRVAYNVGKAVGLGRRGGCSKY